MRELSAGGVVYRQSGDRTEILLIRDRFGRISFPKGKMEPGETTEQTALREILEETGITGIIEAPLPGTEFDFRKESGETVHKVVSFFLVRATGGELRAREGEIAGAAWLSPEDAWRIQRSEGYEGNTEALRRALALLGAEPAPENRFPLWRPGDPLEPFVEHALLKTDARGADIDRLCEEAAARRFHAVCVSGGWVRRCRERLTGTGVKVCAVVGFPLGAAATRAKAFEAAAAVEDGAAEIDVVLSVGRMLEGDYEAVSRDLGAVVQAVQGGALVKAVLETALLTDELKVEACRLAEAAGADFVRTSTGFGPAGDPEADVRLLRSAVSPGIGVKAAGGVSSPAMVRRLLLAGANRIECDDGVTVVTGSAE
jgi:deoxyribose-phosphate aldolase